MLSGCDCGCEIEVELVRIKDQPFAFHMIAHQDPAYLRAMFGTADMEEIGERVNSANIAYEHSDSCRIHFIAAAGYN